MHVGVQIFQFNGLNVRRDLGDTLGEVAQRAEQAGFYSFWVPDHFFQVLDFGRPEDEMLEAWSTLAFIAGRTKRIKLGAMVTGVTYRYPGVLIKTATTLDVLSQGRTYFGLGAAWYKEEHAGLGVPFPSTSERFERMEETLQIAHQMWTGDEKPYHGKHYQLDRPLNSPQSVQRPHPPIVIGGSGERKTLRLVAQYADACNLFALPNNKEEIKHKLDVLRAHCEAVGRPYEAIEKTAIVALPPLSSDGRDNTITSTAAIEYLRELAALGIDHAIFPLPPNSPEPTSFDLFATEVIPQAEQFQLAVH